MSKNAIDDWIKTISKMIEVSFEVGASVSDHSTILGDARESFIRDILEQFLPSSISIGSGQIIDQHGRRSKQVDIIIYRREFPILKTFGAADVYLIEGVIATIEVKSKLDKDNLIKALENSKSVKKLEPTFVESSVIHTYESYFFKTRKSELNASEYFSFKQMVAPETYIFAYFGQELNTTKEHLQNWYISKEGANSNSYYLPEAISTNKIAVVKDLDGVSIPKENCNAVAIKEDIHSIRFIINQLLEQVMRRIGSPQYASTMLQYNILGYSLKADGIDSGWVGFLHNRLKLRDLTLSPPAFLHHVIQRELFSLKGKDLGTQLSNPLEFEYHTEEQEDSESIGDENAEEIFTELIFNEEPIVYLTILMIYCTNIKGIEYSTMKSELLNASLICFYGDKITDAEIEVHREQVLYTIDTLNEKGLIEIADDCTPIKISKSYRELFKYFSDHIRSREETQFENLLSFLWNEKNGIN